MIVYEVELDGEIVEQETKLIASRTARSRRYESRGRSLIAGTTPGVQRDGYRSLLCLLEFEAAGGSSE